ncbi:hypothetical protein [Streptomyces dysideae]|nr:hypothetical protein [Streptomyces dysideae]
MSADRETNQNMTNTDITLLLADAADEVEIGIAPYQAVMRGGRRRRARRWAVAAATALVLAGSSATLAVAGLPGGDGNRGASVATRPPTATPGVLLPQDRSLLAVGTDQGREWQVSVDVWPAPRDESQARASLNAMERYGETPVDIDTPAELVGKIAYFVTRGVGGTLFAPTSQNVVTEADALSGKDIEAVAVPLEPGSDGPQRLVVGHVAKTALQVTCIWKDGTTTEVHRARSSDVNSDEFVIRSPEGSPFDWFVCLAPEGTEYASAKVTG